MPLSPLFRKTDFSSLPGWHDDDQSKAFDAFRRNAAYALDNPHKTGSAGVDGSSFQAAFAAALDMPGLDDGAARLFFEKHFVPFLIEADGFVTGFYEPEVEASPVRTARFDIPLLGVPSDLVKIDESNRPEGLDSYLAFGRQTESGLVEYFDRAEIEGGAVAGKAVPLAWLADPVDAFFIHVQGAARLVMPDGEVWRVTYAAKSGQRFTGPGRVLAELGEIPPEQVTMQSIRAWFAANPGRVNEILHRNRSYIFFRKAKVDDSALGPIAAAKIPLSPGRSLAVDKSIHTFGTPFFIHAPELRAFDEKPFRRLMIAQDTGSAIIGPARGDLFAGSGDAAGEIAGVVRHHADFHVLIPRLLVPEAFR